MIFISTALHLASLSSRDLRQLSDMFFTEGINQVKALTQLFFNFLQP